jgi:quercetin dioxygenase-like cupin family protein
MLALSEAVLITLFALSVPSDSQPVLEADTTLVVHGDERPAVPMAAWEKGSKVRSAMGDKAVGKAPDGAVTYQAKMVRWPTATVKVLTFSRASGGVLHPITDEKTIYVMAGRVQATVNGEAVTLAAGDVASLPEGALRNPGMAGDAVVIAWTADSLTTGATPAVVKAGDVDARTMGGLTLRRYTFPGNSVRSVDMAKGFSTNEASAKTDSMIYVTGGPMKFFQDGQTFDVKRGDFIREVAGLKHYWNVIENSGFVTTSALPIGSGPIDPDKATDR